ncbi:MAG TPA: hypothetical protein VGR45_10350 [Stellaceae bacterium]|nr:hypothetical protein [Stellaceae bacterium]
MIVDLTGVAVAATGGVFSILGIMLSAWLTSHVKDNTARATLQSALDHSLGALQTAATSEIQATVPKVNLPGVPLDLAPGVQYVLDHAGDEAQRLGVTPQAIAEKIEARVGLQNIATNLAVSANATPAVQAPLAPVAPAAKLVITDPAG